ncbi:hypothetical protein BJ912DRAFT_591540 [Pholiota molesta]|nr:hypothetical protein BJ912DRAFT_591540 [Pholiota molesta]
MTALHGMPLFSLHVGGCRMEGSRSRIQGGRFKVQGSRFKVQGSRFKVLEDSNVIEGSNLVEGSNVCSAHATRGSGRDAGVCCRARGFRAHWIPVFSYGKGGPRN